MGESEHWSFILPADEPAVLPLLALAFAVSGRTTSSSRIIESAASNALTPARLIRTIDAYRGQTVTLSAYFTSATDTRALWENEATYRNAEHLRKGSWDKCIIIYSSSAKAKQFNGMHIQISGKATVIDKNDIRSLWICNTVALEDTVITPA